MIFIETTLFTKLIYNYLSDEEFAGLQNYLFNRPNAGDVIPGSGGVRNCDGHVKDEENAVG